VDRSAGADPPQAGEAQVLAARGVAQVAEQRQLGVDVEQGVVRGVGRARQRRAPEQPGRADQDVLLAVEADGVEAGLDQARRRDGAVELAAAQADQEIAAGAEVQVHEQAGMGGEQARQLGDDEGGAELPAGAEGDLHRRQRRRALADAHALGGGGERSASARDQGEAGLGEHHRARRAAEQRGAELFLELADALAERRRGQANRPGGGAERQEIGRGVEAAQALERRQLRRLHCATIQFRQENIDRRYTAWPAW